MEEIEAKEIDLNFIQPYLKKKEKERERLFRAPLTWVGRVLSSNIRLKKTLLILGAIHTNANGYIYINTLYICFENRLWFHHDTYNHNSLKTNNRRDIFLSNVKIWKSTKNFVQKN